MDDEGYVCNLTEASIKKAQEELNEDPKERLGAVKALREWIQQQPHLTVRTDTYHLLAFLRTAKFSQLRARQMIEGFCRIMTKFPQWLRDVDTLDPKMQAFIDSGYLMCLPGVLDNGCRVLLYRMGAWDPKTKPFTVDEEIRAGALLNAEFGNDENVIVNGIVFVCDFTGMTASHLTRWKLDTVRKWNECWQGNIPGRFKAFHYYNVGSIFETMMSMFKTFLKKKYHERIQVHENLESLYKHVPMKFLPDEYLPDDYTGPRVGTTAELVKRFKEKVSTPEMREEILNRTSRERFYYDESKKIADVPQASFRKLNID